MRFFPDGRALYGVDHTVYINGVAVGALAGFFRSGGWCAVTNDLIAGQADPTGADVFHLYKVTVSSNTLQPVDSSGATLVAGGNGVLAASLSPGGVRWPLNGFPTKGAQALGDVAPDGRTATIANAAAGSGLVVYDTTGAQLWAGSAAFIPGVLIRAGGGVVAYQEATGTKLRSLATGGNITFNPRTEHTYQTVPVLVNGVLWLAETTQTTLSIRPANAAQGYVLQVGDTFNVDCVEMSPGVVRVGWCTTAGERQPDLRWAEVTVDTGAWTLGSTGGGGAVTQTPQTPLASHTFGIGGAPSGGGSIIVQPTPTQKTAEAAKLAAARSPRRQYPHVPEVTDPAAQRTIRLLWDRVFDMDEQLNGTKPSALQASTAAVSSSLTEFQSSQSLALQQLSAATTGTPLVVHSFPGGGGSGSGGGGGGGSGGGGGGGGQSGDCAGAPATGHIPAGELTFDRALQIICGTSTEWGGLTSSTLDLATREANAEELIRRMIWHLALGGFTAGRQRNPSTAISKDKLAVVILGETRAFDVFRSFDSFNKTMVVQMNEVFPADLVADSGISD